MIHRRTRHRRALRAAALAALFVCGAFGGALGGAPAAAAGGYIAVASWGTAGTGAGELRFPKGIAVDSSGCVYVSDYGNDCVIKYSASGDVIAVWGHRGSAPGHFWQPGRVAVGPDDSVYVTDALNHRVQRFTPDGQIVCVWGRRGTGKGEFNCPRGIDIGPDGLVYVTDQYNSRIEVFTQKGTFVRSWGSRGSGPGEFLSPKDVAVLPDGRVVVVDAAQDRLQVFTAKGRFLASIGDHGSLANRLDGPRGVSADGDGNIYVCDAMNDRIQEFDSSLTFVRAWGFRGAAPGMLKGPRDTAVAPDGTLVVVDTFNTRIQRFALSPDSDPVAPVTIADAPTGWSRSPLTVTLAATDSGPGPTQTYVRVGATTDFRPYAAPISKEAQGIFPLQYLSVDSAGNQEIVNTRLLRLDWTKPTIAAPTPVDARLVQGEATTLVVRLADNVSPRCRIRLRMYRDSVAVATVDYGWRDAAPTARTLSLRYRCTLPPGGYSVRLFARDGAGNTTYVRGLLRVR